MPGDSEITELLARWSEGRRDALDALLPLVYGELKKIAVSMQPSVTLNPTSVVHELYLRLGGLNGWKWENRKHFYGVAAQMMRRILVDHARARRAAKRPDALMRADLDDQIPAAASGGLDLIALDEALTELSALDARQGQIVELRYFGGLSEQEVADTLSVSRATVTREWKRARAWLYHRMTLA